MLKLSARIVLGAFLIALIFSVVLGMMMIWNEAMITTTNGRLLSSALVVMIACLFYTAVCDSWARIHALSDSKDRDEAEPE